MLFRKKLRAIIVHLLGFRWIPNRKAVKLALISLDLRPYILIGFRSRRQKFQNENLEFPSTFAKLPPRMDVSSLTRYKS